MFQQLCFQFSGHWEGSKTGCPALGFADTGQHDTDRGRVSRPGRQGLNPPHASAGQGSVGASGRSVPRHGSILSVSTLFNRLDVLSSFKFTAKLR